MTAENLLRQQVTVNRPTYGQDSSGGITSPTSAVYTNVAASVQPTTSAVQLMYGQRNLSVTHTIFVTQSVIIHNGDIIVYNSNNYKVQGVRDLISLARIKAIDCMLYMGGNV